MSGFETEEYGSLCGDIFSSTFVTSGIISVPRCITFRNAQMRLAGGVWRFWTISHGTSNLEHRSLVKLVWISLQTLFSVPYPMLPASNHDEDAYAGAHFRLL